MKCGVSRESRHLLCVGFFTGIGKVTVERRILVLGYKSCDWLDL
jgi:hypothetical protein